MGILRLDSDGRVVQVGIDDLGGTGRILVEDLRAYVTSRLAG